MICSHTYKKIYTVSVNLFGSKILQTTFSVYKNIVAFDFAEINRLKKGPITKTGFYSVFSMFLVHMISQQYDVPRAIPTRTENH